MSSSSITKIRPYLYLSSYLSITDEKKVKELGITHIVDATNNPESKRYAHIEYFLVKLEDNENSELRQYFEAAVEFIRGAKEKVRRRLWLTHSLVRNNPCLLCRRGLSVCNDSTSLFDD